MSPFPPKFVHLDCADAPMWGESTQRALSTFAISRERIAPELLQGLAWVKLACARANVETGVLCPVRGEAIEAAAREVIAGRHAGQFPLTVWQSAAGAQSHANMNEVIAARAAAMLDESSGIACDIDPSGDVGLGHDAEDAFPAATHVAAVLQLNQRLLPALARLRGTLAAKSHYYRDCETPDGALRGSEATLGQWLGAFETQLAQAQRGLEAARGPVLELAIGARADDEARTEFAGRVCAALAQETGYPFRPAGDRFAALGAADTLVALHAALRGLALALTQLAREIDDLALARGPEGTRAGDRARRDPVEDVEPALCEAIAMIAAQVMGNDAALSAGASSTLRHAGAARPLIAHALLQSLQLLAEGIACFDAHLLRGLAAPPRSRRRTNAPARARVSRVAANPPAAIPALAAGTPRPRVGTSPADARWPGPMAA